MPGQISKTYASPGLRHGLLLEDHPGVEVTFSMELGTDIGVPEQFGGTNNFCVARIHFPIESGRADVIGYKVVPAKGSADDWGVLCTKTLGRALKRAGYPDDTVDLKALVLWRQREAEIRAIDSGTANLALPPAKLDQAIEAAGTTKDSVSIDDGEAPDTEADAPGTVDEDGIEVAEVIEENDDIADEDSILGMRQLIGQLPGDKQKEVGAWSRNRGIRTSRADLTHSQVDEVVAYVNAILHANAEGHGSDEAETIALLVAGLDETEAKNFRKFCRDENIDPAVAANAPGTLSHSEHITLLGWLDLDEDGESSIGLQAG